MGNIKNNTATIYRVGERFSKEDQTERKQRILVSNFDSAIHFSKPNNSSEKDRNCKKLRYVATLIESNLQKPSSILVSVSQVMGVKIIRIFSYLS